MPVGDVGAGRWEEAGGLTFLAGDAGPGTEDGETERGAGEEGRASLEGGTTAGLAGRLSPPILEVMLGAGEPDRGTPAANRETCAMDTGVSPLSGLLGPATRRNLSSN